MHFALKSGAKIIFTEDVREAVSGANVVSTDTWASMGQENEKETRVKAFAGYQVNKDLMDLAQSHAIFLHCLPAYRGYEVSEEVLEGRESRVFLEAENRLHAQKGIMVYLSKQREKDVRD